MNILNTEITFEAVLFADTKQVTIYSVLEDNVEEVAEYDSLEAAEKHGWGIENAPMDSGLDDASAHRAHLNIPWISGITESQESTLRALAEDWEGSIPELIEAAKALAD